MPNLPSFCEAGARANAPRQDKRPSQPYSVKCAAVLLHGGPQIGGWTARQIHQAALDTFDRSENTYRLNQLRYDLRKLKGHGLIERDGSRYAYRLSPKGIQVALLFLFFHKRLCGPLANSRFHHRPDPQYPPDSPLEAPITAPIPPSNASSISWPQLDRAGASMAMFHSFCL